MARGGRRGGWLVPWLAALLAVPAAVPAGPAPPPAVRGAPPLPAPTGHPERPAAPRAAQLVASVRRALPPGVGNERGLQVRTILAERAISARFPQIREIGGWRPDAMKWHPDGLAIDVMIPDWYTPAGKALGDAVVEFVYANAKRFGLLYMIWQQRYLPADGAPHVMADRGDPNANHYTHVHISTNGGGYPTGGASYYE